MGPAMPVTTPAAGELLERSAELAALDACLAAVVGGGGGRLVLVGGEAGIGKTALVRAFCARAPAPRVLWGACDALFTPRPLGPLLDVAERARRGARPGPAPPPRHDPRRRGPALGRRGDARHHAAARAPDRRRQR